MGCWIVSKRHYLTLDKEVSYIDNLVEEMLNLREKFSTILEEAKLVAQAMASQMPTETEFSEGRKKKKTFSWRIWPKQ